MGHIPMTRNLGLTSLVTILPGTSSAFSLTLEPAQTLDNPAPVANEFLGYAVSVSGSTAVISAPHDDPSGVPDAGTAYVFDITSGALLQTLSNPAPASSDRFGYAVDIPETAAIVGSLGYYEGANDTGTVYVFDLAIGNLLQTLNNPAPQNEDFFGEILAATNTSVLVGAPHNNPGDIASAGSVYVFEAVVPLPAALPLLLAGLGSIALVRVKRR
jgi:hypothetical protein